MSVGVAALDDEHKRLVAMFNDLRVAIENNKEPEVLKSILKDMIVYTATHFKHEEEMFARTGYPDAAAHIKEHKELSKRVMDIKAKSRFGITPELAREIFGFLQFWLATHVLKTDMKFGPFFNSKGIF